MTFTYQFEKADWIAFSIYHLKNSRVHQRERFWVRVGVSIGLLLFGLIVFLVGEKDVGYVIGSCVAAVIVFFAYPRVYDDSTLKRIRKTVGDPDNTKMFGTQSVTLSLEGIHMSQTGAEANIAWDNTIKLAETSDYLFLYTSANIVSIHRIPRLKLLVRLSGRG